MRAEQRPLLRVVRADGARMAEQLMPDEERHPQRAARVARRRLNPDVVERSLPQDPSIGDAVQRDAARQAEVPHAGLRVHMACRPEHRLLGHRLDRRRDVHLALGDRGLRLARRPAEERVELRRGHPEPLAVAEVRQVEAERSVVLQVDQMLPDPVGVARLAVRREAHQLVLARVDAEPREVGERGIEEAERVRKADLVRQLDAVAASRAVGRRGPLADAVHRQDRRLLERRREERAGGVGFVMLREDDRLAVAPAQPTRDLARQAELLARPGGSEPDELPEPARRVGEVGFQQAVELQERLLVEADGIEVFRRELPPRRGNSGWRSWGTTRRASRG